MTAAAQLQFLASVVPLTLDGLRVHRATQSAHVLIIVYVHNKRVIARSTSAALTSIHHVTHTTVMFSQCLLSGCKQCVKIIPILGGARANGANSSSGN